MRKFITITLIVLSALLILDSANAGHAFMMLFLAGVIPGTNVAIDASFMLQLFAGAAGFIVAQLMLIALRAVDTRGASQAVKA